MKNLFALIVTFLFSGSFLFGQLKKGDKAIDIIGNVAIRQDIDNSKYTYNLVGFAPSVDYMVTDKLMAGGGLYFFGSNSWNDDDQIIGSTTYAIRPNARYYFNNEKKVLPFVQINGWVSRTFFDEAVLEDSIGGWSMKSNLEAGITYFIASNVAFEAIMGTKILDSKEYAVDPLFPEKFYFNLGFKTFLNDQYVEKPPMLKNYLKKGNMIIGGSAFFHTINANVITRFSYGNFSFIESSEGFSTGVFPRIKLFKTDRWTVGGGLDFDYLKTGVGYRMSTGIEANSGYYFKMSDKLFLKPEVATRFKRLYRNSLVFLYLLEEEPLPVPISSVQSENRKESLNILSFPISLSLVYFAGNNIIFSSGADLTYYNNLSKKWNDPSGGWLGGYVGLEYFFAPNLSVMGKIQYGTYHPEGRAPELAYDRRPDTRNFDFSFGMNYFIFNN